MRNGLRKVTLILVLFVLALGDLGNLNSSQQGPAPEWAHKLASVPEAGRRTFGNYFWLRRFLETFTFAEGRVPSSYEELMGSLYVPSPDALVNPYTGKPVKTVETPSYGDLVWDLRTPANGGKTKSTVWASLYFDPDGSGQKKEEYLAVFGSDVLIYKDIQVYSSKLKKQAETLNLVEQRMFWLCRNLDIAISNATRNILGYVPRSAEPLLALDWFFPPSILRNPWTGQKMKAVSSETPSTGDFTYGYAYDQEGQPTAPTMLLCYGKGGRIIWPWYWSEHLESEALRKRITGDTRDLYLFP